MPTPAKTSPAKIAAAAYDMLNAEGPDGLTMQAVAVRVGVRAPSLYKHFADRAALLRAVETEALRRLAACLADTNGDAKNSAALRAMAGAYRAFALAAPRSYALIFNLAALGDDANTALRRAAAAPVLERLERRLGDAGKALARARALTAFLHGFVSMEIAGEFRLGGDIAQAFEDGLDLLLRK